MADEPRNQATEMTTEDSESQTPQELSEEETKDVVGGVVSADTPGWGYPGNPESFEESYGRA